MARGNKTIEEKFNSPFASNIRKLMSENNVTQDELARAIGKTRQTVSQYVNGVSEPGYDTLVKIANYFHVSLDYLLGQTADPCMQKSAVDELGISPKAIEWIKQFVKNKTEHFDYDDTSSVFNILLEDESFTVFFFQVCAYFHAKRAECIYESLLTAEFPLDESGCRNIPRENLLFFNKKVRKALEKTAFPVNSSDNVERADYLPHEIADYMKAILEIWDSEPGDSKLLDAMDGLFRLRISELPELRARKAFESLLCTLNRHAEIEGELKSIPNCLSIAMRESNGND